MRKYNLWKEFGCPGYKNKLFGKGKGLVINGDQGIELRFKNGKKVLLGTQRPLEAEIALRKARGGHQKDYG